MPALPETTAHTTPLRRELTLTSTLAIVISNMVGTGIFTTTGYLAGDLGRPALVLGVWFIGGVLAMAGCLAYAELGINFPQAGGEYVYLREAWGRGWGFLSGWVSFLAGFSAPIAAGALAFSDYLGQFFPSLSLSANRASAARAILNWIHVGNGQLVAVSVIAIFALVNILGLRLAAKLQNVLTSLKLGVLATFLGLGFLIGRGHWSNFTLTTARTSPYSLGVQFAVSLTVVMFAYSGWNAAGYVAEEMKEPERMLPLALVIGTGIVVALYLALNIAFLYAVPLDRLKGVVRVGAAAASALFGFRGGALFAAIMALGLLSCVSAMVLVGPRVYYAMALDGCFFPEAARVDGRWRTPVRAILYQAIASALMVLTGTFEALITYIGFTLVLFAAIAAAGLFRLRRRPGWKAVSSMPWSYPAAPALFIGVSSCMLVSTLALRPKPSFLGLLTVAGGGVLYWWRFREGPRRQLVS